MKQKLFLLIYFFIYWFAGCTDCPTQPEPISKMILVQTITLNFSQPFRVESTTLIENNYYEIKFSGEFNYKIADTSFLSQSGIYTMGYGYGLVKPCFHSTFPGSTPLIISSAFITEQNLQTGFNPDGIYFFKGICTQTEQIQFSFQNPWEGKQLLNTSGLITVEIFMEQK